jgi:signal peptidase I
LTTGESGTGELVGNGRQGSAPLRSPGDPRPIISSEPPKTDGIRDTLESIILAIILAFVFRAFVVEAFVIPTGSMAPSLYGKHAEHRCAVCQMPFDYGVRESVRMPDGRIQPGTLEQRSGFVLRCPNCGWTGEGNQIDDLDKGTRPAGDSGDRILVMKWPYDIGGELLGPHRWDVVVFKDPQDGEQNFIKRLLGLPGEVLEIINGDIYAAPIETVPQDIVDALAKPPEEYKPSARRLSAQQEAKLSSLLKIQRKTRVAQQSLWMTHYDHDFKPNLDKAVGTINFDPPRWEPEASQAQGAWEAATPLVRFSPLDEQEHWLKLMGRGIEDHYAYNDVLPNASPRPGTPVGDVRLSFVLFPSVESGRGVRRQGDGYVVVSMQRGRDVFEAKIASDGGVSLQRLGTDRVARPIASAKIAAFVPDKPIRIELQNLDYRVALSIDGQEILATSDAEYAPNLAELLARPYQDGRLNETAIRIGAKGIPLDLRHLKVERDVFYRSDAFLETENVFTGTRNRYAQYQGWGTATNPILLRRDPPEYFCCGDNSPQSKDSRLWWEVCPMLQERWVNGQYQYGTVPGDQLIGRAFFVYWPSGYRLSNDTPAVIPNVGKMRIIR